MARKLGSIRTWYTVLMLLALGGSYSIGIMAIEQAEERAANNSWSDIIRRRSQPNLNKFGIFTVVFSSALIGLWIGLEIRKKGDRDE
ncbi:MAG: hypothetical protein ACRCYP_01660 [Alphaproteobacteria bacterium]